MAKPPADVGRQLVAYQDATAAVRRAVVAYLARTWGMLPGYRDADIDRWVATILPVVGAGLAQTAALTDAYLATVIGLKTGTAPKPIGVRPVDVNVEALRGVPAEEVYQRAGKTVWWELSKGAALGVAAARGLDRAERLVLTDLQLAKTHTSRVALSADSRVVGYERVPEADACELCQGAAGTIYRDDVLMAIHDRCACDTSPVLRSERSLEEEPADAAVEVHEHSEVGPMLGTAGHGFTSEADLPG